MFVEHHSKTRYFIKKTNPLFSKLGVSRLYFVQKKTTNYHELQTSNNIPLHIFAIKSTHVNGSEETSLIRKSIGSEKQFVS